MANNIQPRIFQIGSLVKLYYQLVSLIRLFNHKAFWLRSNLYGAGAAGMFLGHPNLNVTNKQTKVTTKQTAVCASARAWSLPGGLLPSQGEAEYSFSGFIQTNKQTKKGKKKVTESVLILLVSAPPHDSALHSHHESPSGGFCTAQSISTHKPTSSIQAPRRTSPSTCG